MRKRFVIRIVLLILFIFIISIYYIYNNYYLSLVEDELIDDYIESTTTKELITSTSKRITSRLKRITTMTTTKASYVFILEVPKINLKKGIYDLNNKNNNVDKNIEYLSSDLPSVDQGTTILASHNGNTRVSYFKRLEELSNNDKAYIYYNGIKYIYEVYDQEVVDKIGTIKVNKNKQVSNLILISCKNGTNDKQIVYKLKLINKESY